MKLFTIIFTAILSAAVVIFGIRGRTDAFSDLSRTRATTEWARQNSDALKKQTDEINRAREELWQKTVRRINASGPPDQAGRHSAHGTGKERSGGCEGRTREGELLTEENEGNKVFPLTLSSLSSLPSVNSSYPTLNVERFLL